MCIISSIYKNKNEIQTQANKKENECGVTLPSFPLSVGDAVIVNGKQLWHKQCLLKRVVEIRTNEKGEKEYIVSGMDNVFNSRGSYYSRGQKFDTIITLVEATPDNIEKYINIPDRVNFLNEYDWCNLETNPSLVNKIYNMLCSDGSGGKECVGDPVYLQD